MMAIPRLFEQLLKDGLSETVFDFYNALIAEKENDTVKVIEMKSGKTKTISGTGEARVESIVLYNSKGVASEYFSVGEEVELMITVKVYEDLESLVLGYGIKDHLGQIIYGTNTWHTKQRIKNTVKGSIYKFSIKFSANFGIGSYSIQTALHDKDTHLTARVMIISGV